MEQTIMRRSTRSSSNSSNETAGLPGLHITANIANSSSVRICRKNKQEYLPDVLDTDGTIELNRILKKLG
jgi:hypothetical protein